MSLASLRTQVDQFLHRAQGQTRPDPLLLEQGMAELGTALEELRATEEELRAQNDALVDAHQQLATQRERYRELFNSTPAPYLAIDPVGTVRTANLQAVRLPASRMSSCSAGPWSCSSPARTAGGSGTCRRQRLPAQATGRP